MKRIHGGREEPVRDGFTPMYASVVVDEVEIDPKTRRLVGVRVTLPREQASLHDKGSVQFDRPLMLDVSMPGAMIGFFLTREAQGWQLLLRTEGGKMLTHQVSVGTIAGLDVPEISIPPV
jgi:hypothetical protein